MSIKIDDVCTGCGACVAACPLQALSLATELPKGRGRKRALVDPLHCCDCGGCIACCPHLAMHLDLNLSRKERAQNDTNDSFPMD